MEPLEVGLLGPVETRVGGEVVDLSGASQRVLLARLALSPGRVVPTATLLEALWPGEAPANATGNLHSYVSRLRRVVGSARILREPSGYRLDLDRGSVDVGRVESLAEEARLLAGEAPEEAAALLAEALAMWRGEPLADLPDPFAFAPELARLEEMRRHLTEESLELEITLGRAATALPDLERAVASDPGRERLHLLLMQALHQVGRTAEALRVADRFRHWLVQETGLDPSPALTEFEERLFTSGSKPTIESDTPSVRPPRDRFVGRDAEMDEVKAALTGDPLVTVVGPGGVGKTRLVLEVLARRPAPGVVHVVQLSGVSSGEDVTAAVADGVGLQSASGGIDAAIVERLALGTTVLVLDGCEHVLGTVRKLVRDLLAASRDLTIVVTSRRRLGLPAERVIRIGPLPADDQIELFCDRAALARGDFDVASPHARALAADICMLVDGLPLGVELAARRESVFGLRQLREHLAGGLDVLESVAEDDPALTSMVEWSYRLLDPTTRRLFDRLSVCSGGFTLGALDHFVEPEARNAAGLLAELVEASLVVSDVSVDPPRYQMLDTMRHVGRRHLSQDDVAEARRAHARWMQAHIESVVAHQERRSPLAGILLRRETGNLREALAWLIESSDWKRASALAVPTVIAVSDDPHLDLVSQLRRLAAGVEATDRLVAGRCALAAAGAAWVAGDAVSAEPLVDTAIDLVPEDDPYRWVVQFFRQTCSMFSGVRTQAEEHARILVANTRAPDWARATAVCSAALVNLYDGDSDAATEWMQRHVRLLDEVGTADGFVAYTRGELVALDDPEAALHLFEEAYRKCEHQGHVYNREVAAIGRAAVLIRTRQRSAAATACRNAIDHLGACGMWGQMWIMLRLTAELLVMLDDLEAAAVLLAAADADPAAPALFGPDQARIDGLWHRIRSELDPDRIDRATNEGRTTGRRGAVRRALEALGP